MSTQTKIKCMKLSGMGVLALIALVSNSHANPGDQLAKMLASDGAANDEFGAEIAISGTIAVFGVRGDDDNGDASGSCYLFNATTGVQSAKILPNDGAAGDQFGASVAISGTMVIVGATQDDDNGPSSGSAYIFDISDLYTPVQVAKLSASDGAASDMFGRSVAIINSPGIQVAVVSAYWDDDNGTDSGSAYLFDISDPSNPVQIAKLLPSDGAAGDWFGRSVSVSGGTAIVSAHLHDDIGVDSGAAYLFDTTTGQQMAKVLPTDGAAGDRFGWSVAIDTGTAVIGAMGDDDNGTDSGSAYLFDVSIPGDPVQTAKILPSDGAVGDQFGICVGISSQPGSQTAVVGSLKDDDHGPDSGSAYLFDISNTSNPLLMSKLIASDGASGDILGVSVAVSGSTAIAGAARDDDMGTDSGSAYLFAAATCLADLTGDSVLDFFDVAAFLGMFSIEHPDSDWNGDGVFDFFDVMAFLADFSAGCP
jgi:FG-GAP repeat protein